MAEDSAGSRASDADFEVQVPVGWRRELSHFGDGDVVAVLHRPSGRTLAMRRLEVRVEFLDDAEVILQDFLRSASLAPHRTWMSLEPELCYVRAYMDGLYCQRARVCIVEELADCSLELEIVRRGGERRPFGKALVPYYAELVIALQALHAQGCLHRDICARSIFLQKGEVRLGRPGPLQAPPSQGYYPSGRCEAFSADVFALGVVFLEMALLLPLGDLATPGVQSPLQELEDRGAQLESLTAWLSERTDALGLSMPDDDVVLLLAAMLARPVTARASTDDLLDMPILAPYADARQVKPVFERPCVVLSHDRLDGSGAEDLLSAPQRSCTAMPWMHQIFSREGATTALREGCYSWCGREYEIWYVEEESLGCAPSAACADADASADAGGDGLAEGASPSPPPPPTTAAAAAAAAREHRRAGRLMDADVCGRAALRAALSEREAGEEDVDLWLDLGGIFLERNHLHAGRLAFEHARNVWLRQRRRRAARDEATSASRLALSREASPPPLPDDSSPLPTSAPLAVSLASAQPALQEEEMQACRSRLWNLCEFFLAVEALRLRVDEVQGTREGRPGGLTNGGGRAAGAHRVRPSGLTALARNFREGHVELYYRSALAAEAGNAEVFAAVGEFYRRVGCPSMMPFSAPVPDIETAASYFEQALSVDAEARLARQRLDSLRDALTELASLEREEFEEAQSARAVADAAEAMEVAEAAEAQDAASKAETAARKKFSSEPPSVSVVSRKTRFSTKVQSLSYAVA
eukprot:TRINITY_DN11678_c1_g1_i1.p1 TRINITY_DN11678_c1_g1~~TRINITY_DN11678_c1_g1_i1.p1  ORF type:complete len:757 (+),score=172.63 TRINITY_DN11678_c1_g1_i1:113-2383(+)